ncbi:MAG: hypothetical protein ACXQTR_06935 [Candidatus Methanospirareceae archaeon]
MRCYDTRRILDSDNGYFNGSNLRYMEERRLDGYIPDRKQAGEGKIRDC